MSKSSLNKVLVKSPAKINLHLEVIGKRMDGYHELAMIMQNIDLSDFIDLKINQNGKIKLTSDSKSLSLNDDNLIIKAANILKKISNNKFGADIFLRKNIPIGACEARVLKRDSLSFRIVSYSNLSLMFLPLAIITSFPK